MTSEWIAWTAGPLIGAAAGALATWFIDQGKRSRTASDELSAKVQDHEVRITVLEKEGKWREARGRVR